MERILLIEDDVTSLRALRRLLARKYPLVPVHTAETLDDAILLGLSNYSIVVTDGNYPTTPGDRPTKQVPTLWGLCRFNSFQTVIGYVGNTSDVDAATRHALGENLVEKPAVDELLERIDLALERRDGSRR